MGFRLVVSQRQSTSHGEAVKTSCLLSPPLLMLCFPHLLDEPQMVPHLQWFLLRCFGFTKVQKPCVCSGSWTLKFDLFLGWWHDALTRCRAAVLGYGSQLAMRSREQTTDPLRCYVLLSCAVCLVSCINALPTYNIFSVQQSKRDICGVITQLISLPLPLPPPLFTLLIELPSVTHLSVENYINIPMF